MSDELRDERSGATDPRGSNTQGRIVLLFDHEENRRRLRQWLDTGSPYTPVVATDPEEVDGDLCLVDPAALARHHEWIETCKRREQPQFFPVLLAAVDGGDALSERLRSVVDEVVSTPIRMPKLRQRLETLIERRRLSADLATRLERSEERYEAIFAAVDDALLIVDPAADRVIESNPRATELLGYAHSELASLSPSSDLHRERPDAFRAFVQRVLEEGRARTEALTCTRKDGTVIETAMSASVLDRPDGGRPHVVLSIRDVTERHERERTVERQRDRLDELTRITRTLQETTAAVVQAADREELERSVCRRLAESEPYQFAWIGERTFDTGGDPVVARATGGDAAAYLDRVDITAGDDPTGQGPTGRALRTRNVETARRVDDDPQMAPWRDALRAFDVCATAAVPIQHDGSLFGVLNLYTDREDAFGVEEREILADLGRTIGREITGIRAREEAELFEQAIEHTGHAVYITDTEGTIQYANRAFERSTGYQREEALGRTPRILRSGEHDRAFYRDLWETITAGESWENEVVNRRKDGRRQYIDQTITPIFGDDGTVERFVAVNTDITERRRRRQQLQVLYRVLRHNLRNELNIIDGYADLLRERGVDAESAIPRIVDAVDELLRISDQAQRIEDTFSNDERHSVVRPLDRIVERTKRDVVDPASDVDASVDVPQTTVRVDAELETAIEELLRNAIQHNDAEQPTVRLAVDVASDAVNPHATIVVRDNGPGIPEHERLVLEEGEETPLLHGSGLGLWLVNWVVTELGGRIRITDNDPRGTVVSITLPVRA
ncbi:PAS domain S-box protein [Halobellus sp. Atlit-31R]|nr:PAS domain S-box protein [Halobellus sp. Atlit-31R]